MKRKVLSVILAFALCVSLAVPAIAAVGETLTFSIGSEEEPLVFTVSDALLSDETVTMEDWPEGFTEEPVYYVLDGVSVITVIDGGFLQIGGLTLKTNDANGKEYLSLQSPPLILFASSKEIDDGSEDFNETFPAEKLITYEIPERYYDSYDNCFFADGIIFKVVDDLTVPPSEWAVAEVSAAIEAELVPENLQMNYTKAVSRGDVAQMFINLIEKSSGQTIDEFLTTKSVSINDDAFTDTTDKAVLAANALGIINGIGDSKFDPNGTLTRAQIAAIINRVANALDISTEGYTHEFTDVAGHWVDAELGWPVHAGVVNGIGNNQYNPEGQLTVEAAIAIIYRAAASLS